MKQMDEADRWREPLEFDGNDSYVDAGVGQVNLKL